MHRTPSSVAADGHHDELVRFLVARGARPRRPEPESEGADGGEAPHP
jgi:hypothetical protein